MFRVNKKKPILIITTELPVSWTTGRKVVVSKLKKKIFKWLAAINNVQTAVRGYIAGSNNWHFLSKQKSDNLETYEPKKCLFTIKSSF